MRNTELTRPPVTRISVTSIGANSERWMAAPSRVVGKRAIKRRNPIGPLFGSTRGMPFNRSAIISRLRRGAESPE